MRERDGSAPAGPRNGVTVRNRKTPRRLGACALWIAVVLTAVMGARAQEETAESRKIASIKRSQTKSMVALRSYEWIETVTVKVGGDEKSRKQNRCYYGADAVQQKVPVEDGDGEESHFPPGIRGRIARRRAADMQKYIQQALGLVKQYVPPDPQRLQAVKDKGTHRLEVLDGASRLRADFADYLKAGDLLFVDVDPDADRIVGISVSTYLDDDPEDAVKLDVTFGTFQDGTSYPARVELKGERKELDIVIENTGYRKSGS